MRIDFLFLTSICTGCGHKTETGEREIVLAAARDLVQGEKDPYYATIILKTWEPLVGISDDGHEMPVLAESWESNADKTEWIFHLKEGVRFHDGELFNAAAALEISADTRIWDTVRLHFTAFWQTVFIPGFSGRKRMMKTRFICILKSRYPCSLPHGGLGKRHVQPPVF